MGPLQMASHTGLSRVIELVLLSDCTQIPIQATSKRKQSSSGKAGGGGARSSKRVASVKSETERRNSIGSFSVPDLVNPISLIEVWF